MRRDCGRDAVVGHKSGRREPTEQVVGRKFIAHSFIRGATLAWNFSSSCSFHFDSTISFWPPCGTRIAPISPVSVCLPLSLSDCRLGPDFAKQ